MRGAASWMYRCWELLMGNSDVDEMNIGSRRIT